MEVHLLVNLLAGSGRAAKTFARVKKLLQERGVKYSVKISNYAGEMVSMAQISSDLLSNRPQDLLAVIGGDGSLNQALNGIKHSHHPQQPIFYFPSGTGDDFARANRLTTDPSAAVDRLLHPQVEAIDCIHYRNLKSGQDGYFVNNLGIGFDAYVVQKSNRSHLKKELGHAVYGLNTVTAIFKQKLFACTIHDHQRTLKFHHVFLLTMTNHPYFGGGIKILPAASPHNHQIGVIVSERPHLKQALPVAIHLLTDGKHVDYPFFHYHFTDHLTVENTGQPQYGQLDGEELGWHNFKISYRISSFNLLI